MAFSTLPLLYTELLTWFAPFGGIKFSDIEEIEGGEMEKFYCTVGTYIYGPCELAPSPPPNHGVGSMTLESAPGHDGMVRLRSTSRGPRWNVGPRNGDRRPAFISWGSAMGDEEEVATRSGPSSACN